MVQAPYPEPGTHISLGAQADTLDAQAMIAVLRAANGVRSRHSISSGSNMAREALWECWEKPRLPRPLVSGKYPKPWPWSPGARQIYDSANGRRPKAGGWGLIFEHVSPRGLIISSLIDVSDALTPEIFIDRIYREMRGAVITTEESRRLDTAKGARCTPKAQIH